ncbi:MAG: ABC transporter ATP-binding protein [Rhodobacteraceae bacterium]|nr:ABC transporter ATP-binding protein [Paracoccaceae bacterium]
MSGAPILALRGVGRAFALGGERLHAVDAVDLDIPTGEFFTLLGPSGCGKTTLLRMIAGLERPDTGRIDICGLRVFDAGQGVDVAAASRGLGMVFQSCAVWPHMTVFENVAFALRTRPWRNRLRPAEIAARALAALEAVALGGIEQRRVSDLSGGQKQRLALARALVAEPKLILLDEPMSSLDAKLREHLRRELKALQQSLGLTFLLVTHDQGEALAMSHRVAVMRQGRIEQIGTPREIYRAPANAFVAEFIGNGTVVQSGIAAPVLYRPEDIGFSTTANPGEGWLPCQVLTADYSGSFTDLVVLAPGDVRYLVRVAGEQALPDGRYGFIRLDPAQAIRLR